MRTYTDAHGLKNLTQEFCNTSLDKRQGSSDWNKDINDLSDKQLEYAANDVIYLHKIKSEFLIISKALSVISPRFPIGVATQYSPGFKIFKF